MPRPSARSLLNPPSPPPQTIPDDLLTLRRQWKWAAFCQFFVTFGPVFAAEDVTITDIENDLVHSTSVVIPRLMQRMLYCLTYDRKISLDNWQAALIKQYFKRAPDANPLGGEPQGRYSKSIEPSTVPSSPKIEESDGPEQSLPRGDDAPEDNEPTTSNSSDEPSLAVPESVDEPEVLAKDWFKLSLLEKLDSMHLLTEWQFQNPTRLKQVMKSEDENASWRIEPIGFDSKKNAYWLIGEDRLWIQRNPPRPNLKRKRIAKPPAKPAPTKRSRVEASARNKRSSIVIPAKDTPSGRGPGRAAKLQAKQKLDAQAKELAELNRQAALATPSKSTRRTRSNAPNTSPSPSKLPGRSASNARPLGTRLSLRLRGSLNDEWQSVPDEWLAEPKSEQSKPSLKTGLESDDETVSDLTELSEDVTPPKGNSEEPAAERISPPQDEHPEPPAEKAQSEQPDQNGSEHPADFVEWETIAVTLEEWQSVAEPFAKATHYSEKALFKVLTAVAAIIVEQLEEIDRKRRKEEAITHRKRSSRLALREIEKEEARLAAKKRADEEEKHSRARRAEARQQKEESERQRRENAREQRRMEREAKEAAQEPTSTQPPSAVGTRSSSKVNGTASGSRTPNSDWELDCEVCHRHGLNLDDGKPMMSCGSCSKWQHISCHDRADHAAGRPKRNWDDVEFLCSKCKAANGQLRGRPNATHPITNGHATSIQLTAPYHDPSKTAGGVALQNHPSGSYAPVPTYLPPHQHPITFSHYQPQQRVFLTSQVHQPYGAAVNYQPYGSRPQGVPQPLPHPPQGWHASPQAQAYYNPSSERLSAAPPRQPQQGEPMLPNNAWYPPQMPTHLPAATHPQHQLPPQTQVYPP